MSGRALIIGGGVTGLNAALCCAERGLAVTLVERNGERRGGCSFGNAGIVVPSHFVPLAAPGMVRQALASVGDPAAPFHLRPRLSWQLAAWCIRFARAAAASRVRRAAPLLRSLALTSRDCYEALSRTQDDFGYARTGTLMLCRTPHGLDEESRSAKLATELGIEARVVDPLAAAALEPALQMSIVGAVHYPGDARVVADRLMATLQQRAAAAGVRFIWGAEVSGWDLDAANRIRAARLRDGGQIDADSFVLCAGVWSCPLAERLGLRLPMQAGKGYSLTLPHPRLMPERCSILTEARVAVTPLPRALRFAGTLDLDGLNEDIRGERARAIVAAAARYYPDLRADDFDGVEPWCGLRPCSPDGLPYLGRTRRCSNLVVATGHAMLGMTLGPVTGRIVGALLAGSETGFDLDLLSPDRFS